MALRQSVSFFGVDWAAEDEKLRARVNRRKEKRSRNCRKSKQKSKMSKEQRQVKDFVLHIAVKDDEAFQTICIMDSAKTFLQLMEPPPSFGITTNHGRLIFAITTFDFWKENDSLFPKALKWMTDAIEQQLYSHPETATTSPDKSTSTISSSRGNDEYTYSAAVDGESVVDRDSRISSEISVDPGKAKSFQSLIGIVGAEKFIDIEKETK